MGRLSRLLRPQSVAYIGGSQVAGAIRATQRAQFDGSIHVVNPHKEHVEGVACVASISALPLVPDAAVVGLSAERSITAVAELSAAGCGGAVVMVSGFAELNTNAGRDRQQQLIEAAGDMPLLGPNCMGLMNQFSGAFVWGDDNHCERQSGNAAAIISQSGALLIGMTGVEQAFPLGYAISVGNQSVTTTAELIEEILQDKRINAIGLYLEGMDNGDALGRACYKALKQGVPVVALKGGDQTAGESVARSHTASMVVERDLWESFKTRFGIEEVSSPKALVEALKLLSVAGLPADGGRLSIVSYSGGLNGLAATRSAAMGLVLNMPTRKNIDWLRQALPETVAIANPLDLNIPFSGPAGTISMQDTAGVAQSMIRFAEDVADQLVFFIDVPRAGAGVLDQIWSDSLDALIEVRQALAIPVCVAGILPGGLPTELCLRMQRHGIACLQGYTETMEALGISTRLAGAYRALPEPMNLINVASLTGTSLINEAESKRALVAHGLDTPRFIDVAVEDALLAAEQIGYPLVCKVLSDRIAHKASVGGVKLGIENPAELKESLSQMCMDLAAQAQPVTHVLLEEMVARIDVEVIVGVKRHTALGYALMIGMGGVTVEELARYQTLLLPCTDDEIKTAVAALGLQHHVAAAGLIAACKSVVEFTLVSVDSLESLDVNPLVLTADGRAVATDALICCSA